MALIDRDTVLEIVGGDISEAKNVIGMLFDSTRDQVLKLHAGLQGSDRKALEEAAHQLAGATSTCGLYEISEHFRALEENAHTESFDLLTDRVNQADELLRQAEAECNDLFSDSSEGHPK